MFIFVSTKRNNYESIRQSKTKQRFYRMKNKERRMNLRIYIIETRTKIHIENIQAYKIECEYEKTDIVFRKLKTFMNFEGEIN
jgi:hypothetical protein